MCCFFYDVRSYLVFQRVVILNVLLMKGVCIWTSGVILNVLLMECVFGHFKALGEQ